MCFFVIIFASVPYLVMIYFCKIVLRDTSCFVSQKNVLTLKFVHCFFFPKFADALKIKIISMRSRHVEKRVQGRYQHLFRDLFNKGLVN